MVGVVGIEPTHVGVKVRCLTTWLHPKVSLFQKKLEYYINIEKKSKLFCFLNLLVIIAIQIALLYKFYRHMFWFLKILTKRPTDLNIRLFKILFWLILSVWAYYSFFMTGAEWKENLMFDNFIPNTAMVYSYALVAMWAIIALVWIADLNLLKSKYARILHILVWIDLLFAMWYMKETATLGFDTVLLLLWIIAIISGVTGKFITKKWLRAAQKVTKIRV